MIKHFRNQRPYFTSLSNFSALKCSFILLIICVVGLTPMNEYNCSMIGTGSVTKSSYRTSLYLLLSSVRPRCKSSKKLSSHYLSQYINWLCINLSTMSSSQQYQISHTKSFCTFSTWKSFGIWDLELDVLSRTVNQNCSPKIILFFINLLSMSDVSPSMVKLHSNAHELSWLHSI